MSLNSNGKWTSEAMLDKIGKNATYCLETMSMDVDNLDNCTDFVTSVKRGKAKADPCATPVKRRRISKKNLIEAARADEEEQPVVPVKKAKVAASAKAFISDEAEEEQDEGRIIAWRSEANSRGLENDNRFS